MEEKKRRSYAKESTKSKPSGVRFDLEKVEFVKTKEELNTYQKVVDFLLNKYWWEFKIAKPTHKEVPPIDKADFERPEPIKKSVWDELPQQQIPTYKTAEQFKKEKRECETEDDWLKLKAEIENSNLTAIQKNLLIKYN